MQSEIIPGSLFVLITAAVAIASGQYLAALLLAVGCFFGWLMAIPERAAGTFAQWMALGLWTIGFFITLLGVL